MLADDDQRHRLAREVAASVVDPEIPVLTLEDLGVLRDVELHEDGRLSVRITPTYSGCPAVEIMKSDLASALSAAGFDRVEVSVELAPAWGPELISEAGRQKLFDYGIAPPVVSTPGSSVPVTIGLRCPQCGSTRTSQTSAFGATACKSLWKCRSCMEVFEHFKSI